MTMSKIGLAALGAALLLAGCGGGSTASAPVSVPSGPAAVPKSADCKKLYEGAFVSRLPEGTELKSVSVCHPMAGMEAHIATSTENLGELSTGLALNDAVLNQAAMCTKEMRDVPDFIVETVGGQKVAPAVPIDECGKPVAQVWNFLAALPTS